MPLLSQATKSQDVSKVEKEAEYSIKDNSSGWAEKFMVSMELRRKLLTFRDTIDLPPCDDAGPLHEVIL